MYRPCSFEGCADNQHAKGYCHAHLRQLNKGQVLKPKVIRERNNGGVRCKFEDCPRRANNKGYCKNHYEQAKKGRIPSDLVLTDCAVLNCIKPAIAHGLCDRHYYKVHHYKMTPEEVIILYSDATCANPGCSSTYQLHVDHDHKTGKVRGLLCNTCNTSLGLLSEDKNRITGLITYLETTSV